MHQHNTTILFGGIHFLRGEGLHTILAGILPFTDLPLLHCNSQLSSRSERSPFDFLLAKIGVDLNQPCRVSPQIKRPACLFITQIFLPLPLLIFGIIVPELFSHMLRFLLATLCSDRHSTFSSSHPVCY